MLLFPYFYSIVLSIEIFKMRVFKFGGASVKDAEAVRNLAKILSMKYVHSGVLVVSAMGKTTNALEEVLQVYYTQGNWQKALSSVFEAHVKIAQDLVPNDENLMGNIRKFYDEVHYFLDKNKSPNRSFVYDQVVSLGELLSTYIIAYFLNQSGIKVQWLDAREYVKTDNQYQEGIVDWAQTEEKISKLDRDILYITQGFIGSDEHGFTTTLGREGSDYSAAIFAYALDAQDMTIWKDVPGVMTADPRYFPEAQLLTKISYKEAIEMAYFGASVIHPKTLQPLQQKNIPFFVRSFVEPHQEGTMVGNDEKEPLPISYILKQNQKLLSISTRDFSFIAENHLSFIFDVLAQHRIKVSLMQNSAISLMLCLEDKFENLPAVIDILQPDFRIEYKENLYLLTVRNLKTTDISPYKEGKNIVLEQLSQHTLQLVFSAK